MKKTIAAAALSAAISLAAPAGAQVQAPGFFGSLTGWHYLDSGGDTLNFSGNAANIAGAAPEDGWGGRAYLGYRFGGDLDIAAGVQGSWLKKGKNIFLGAPFAVDADYRLADLELGFNGASGNFGYRLFVGARYVDFQHKYHAGLLLYNYEVEFKGIGPRIGADFAWRLAPGSSFSLVGNVAAAALFGKREEAVKLVGFSLPSPSRGKTIFNADGQLGVDWEIAPLTHIAVGYRAEWWKGVADSNGVNTVLIGLPEFGKPVDRFMHGPFARVSYNIGAPRGVMPVAAPAPMISVVKPNYIVFFDFDRSNLTPTSLATIKQAADAAKAGKSARVGVTGHADKSGTDAYNMALSLRRANTVKDELVRNGVPAASIVVVGRGESAPLVPTADGVREPQNRRVEIVLQ